MYEKYAELQHSSRDSHNFNILSRHTRIPRGWLLQTAIGMWSVRFRLAWRYV